MEMVALTFNVPGTRSWALASVKLVCKSEFLVICIRTGSVRCMKLWTLNDSQMCDILQGLRKYGNVGFPIIAGQTHSALTAQIINIVYILTGGEA
jgi:hypothetical protein